MKDEPKPRIFDINPPRKVGADPTSRPVIVGHRPTMPDPMMRLRPAQPTTLRPVSQPPATQTPEPTITPSAPPAATIEPAPPPPAPEPATAGSMAHPPEPPAQPPAQQHDHRPPKTHWLVWLVGGLLALLIGFYLLVDSGKLNVGFKMPFHLFEQKEDSGSDVPPPVPLAGGNATANPDCQPGASSETLNWTSFTAATGKYCLSHDPAWLATYCDTKAEGVDTRGGDVLLVDPSGKKAPDCKSDGEDWRIFGFSSPGNTLKETAMPFDQAGIHQKTTVTIDGVSASKYEGKVQAASGNIPPNGSKQMLYLFFANNRTYWFEYDQWPNETDYSQKFDTMVANTLRFIKQDPPLLK